MKFYYFANVFDLFTFGNETTALLKIFEISTEMHSVSLFSLNERNVTTSLLMVLLKFTIVHYANLNSGPVNKHYLRVVYALFAFFRFLVYVYFNDVFVKDFMKKL